MKTQKLMLGFITIGVALLLSTCFFGSSILFLESDTKGKPNLIFNPGFETNPLDEKRMPPGWLLMDSKVLIEDHISCDFSKSVLGFQSLKVSGNAQHLMIISEPFAVDSFGGYFVKSSAHGTTLKGPKLKLKFIGYSEHGKIRSTYTTTLKTSNDWVKATLSVGFLKPDVRFGRVLLVIPPLEDDSVRG